MSNFTEFTWNWEFLITPEQKKFIAVNDLVNFLSTCKSNLKVNSQAESVLKELQEIFNEKT